jgi:hypothetical protein
LLVGTTSPLSYAGGGAWNNSNKLHQTTEVFVFQILFVRLFFFVISF